MFDGTQNAEVPITQIKTGVLRTLQEDETCYYATAVIEKTSNRLKIATVSWLKEPLELWLARAESQISKETPAVACSYRLPTISDVTGGCIDDTWIATSTTNAPTARVCTAVWTGNEMIVWGGFGDSGYLNTGGRYNPATDSWTATSTSNAPGGRSSQTAIWADSEMIVWGGYNGMYLNTGGRYNPSTDSWVATSITNLLRRRARRLLP